MSSPLLLARRVVLSKPGTAEAEALSRAVAGLLPGDRLRFTAELRACRAAMRGKYEAKLT